VKIVSARVHAYFDYALVLLLVLGPLAIGLDERAATVAYVLAMAHCGFTLMTAFGLGAARAIPLPVHGACELGLAVGLVLAPWAFAFEPAARLFFVAIAALVGLSWLVSDYHSAAASLDEEPFRRTSII
jgi:hypothetical protein